MKSKKGSSDGQPSLGGAVDGGAKGESTKSSKSEKRSKKDKHRDDRDRDGHHHSKKSKSKSSLSSATAAASEKSNNPFEDQPGSGKNPSSAGNGGGAPPSNKKPKKSRHAALHSSRLLHPPPSLDPLLLSRGMSSRYLSSKVSHQLTPLGKDCTERDLRHMEAYRNACNGYNQQLFVFENQDMVRSGYFGTFAPLPGSEGDDARAVPLPASAGSVPPGRDPVPGCGSKVHMPIRIDPEEEKRLSLLRKRIHQSEFERERLETEYLSLRAHYVHEIKLVRKARTYELGRWEVLRECARRRGRALAWARARVAVARDAEALLGYRGWMARRARDGEIPNASAGGGIGGQGNAQGEGKKGGADVVRAWNDINAQLKKAEEACAEVETPTVLSQMVLSAMAETSNSANGSRSRSPTRGAVDGSDRSKGRKRSNSVTDEAASGNDNDSGSGSNGKKGKSPIPEGLEPHVIPWDCVVEPQTPYEVPLLLSCLSSATDKAVGFVTDKSDPTAITWLESTLPATKSAYDVDTEALAKLREEVRVLEEELGRESDTNTKLQEQIIKSRKRSDQLVSMMQLLRSETEAVLERHNLVLETPEARAKAAELHQKLLEEEKLKNPPADGEEEEEEEGEVDELNEDLSSVDDEIQDEDEEEDRSDDDSVGIKEITVDNDSNAVHEGEETDASEEEDDEGSEEEGEIAEGEEEGEENADEVGLDAEGGGKNKRRPSLQGGDDEESSSLTPPNTGAQKKRRRY